MFLNLREKSQEKWEDCRHQKEGIIPKCITEEVAMDRTQDTVEAIVFHRSNAFSGNSLWCVGEAEGIPKS